MRKVFRHQSHRIDYIAEKDNTWWWWRQWRRMTLASSPFALVVLELGNPNCGLKHYTILCHGIKILCRTIIFVAISNHDMKYLWNANCIGVRIRSHRARGRRNWELVLNFFTFLLVLFLNYVIMDSSFFFSVFSFLS